MFSNWRKNVDPETGEIVESSNGSSWSPPSLKNARRVKDVAGELPQYINLKDHPELSGVEIAIVSVSDPVPGDLGDYVKIACYPLKDGEPGKPIVIVTGAENVLNRALAIQGEASPETPVIGTLREVGNATRTAWLLE